MNWAKLRAMLDQRAHREAIYSTAEFWDGKAIEYEGDAVSMWANNNLNRLYHIETVNMLSNELPDLNGKAVLDLGCGTGRISRWLAARGAVVSGVDFSARSIEIAKGLSDPGNPAYRHLSMFDLDDRGRYDLLFSWGSITVACRNAEELRVVLARLRRSLMPGGRVLLVEPVHRGFLHRVLNMDINEFCDHMSSAGFQVEPASSIYFWPARLALCYVSLPTWVTTPIYTLGQAIMRVPGFRHMGDYRVIRAVATGDA